MPPKQSRRATFAPFFLVLVLGMLVWLLLRKDRQETAPVAVREPESQGAPAKAPQFLLQLEPLKRKDMKAGHWLELAFKIGWPDACKPMLKGSPEGPIYVRLEKSGRFWDVAECSRRPGGSGEWIRGDAVPSDWLFRSGVRFGIERYYLSSDDPLLKDRRADLMARVELTPRRGLRLVELVPLQ